MIRVKAATNNHVSVPTEKFLQEVEKRPCLWDPNHTLYRNADTRALAFRSIAVQLIPNAPSTKMDEIGTCLSNKWTGIREHYFVVRGDPSMKKRYEDNRYIQLLAFLEPTLPARVFEANPLSRSPTNGQSGKTQSTVVIDGVEFEQVTLDNGEVIVKLKEEVLDGCPQPKKVDTEKKKLNIPAKNPQGNHGMQPAERSKQVDNQNGNQTQQHSNQSQTVSLRIKPIEHTERQNSQSPIDELKIVSTTTLASNDPQKVNIVGNKKCIRMKDQKVHVELVSVDEMIKRVTNSAQGVFKKLSDVLEPTDKANSKLEVVHNPESIEISDDEGHSEDNGLARRNAEGEAQKTNHLDRWDAELKRLAALPKTNQRHSSNLVGQLPNLDEEPVTSKSPLSSDSCSADGSKTSRNLTPVKGMKTNRNTVVQKNLNAIEDSSSADGQKTCSKMIPAKGLKTNRNTAVVKTIDSKGSHSIYNENTSPNLISIKGVRTNLNTVIEETLHSRDSPSAGAKESSPVLTPVKMLKTNRNTAVEGDLHSNDSRSEDDKNASPNLALVKRARTDRNTVVESSTCSQSNPRGKFQTSTTIEIIDDDDEELAIKNPKENEVEPQTSHEYDDGDKAFVLSLLPEMASLTEAENYRFRLDVLDAIRRNKYS